RLRVRGRETPARRSRRRARRPRLPAPILVQRTGSFAAPAGVRARSFAANASTFGVADLGVDTFWIVGLCHAPPTGGVGVSDLFRRTFLREKIAIQQRHLTSTREARGRTSPGPPAKR